MTASVPIEAGFAEIDITPPLDLKIAGSLFPRDIEGLLDPLMAHAMVLRSGETTLAIVTCDLLVLSQETVASIRKDVERTIGIPGAHVAISATHTHTGPYTCTTFGCQPDYSYVQALKKKIVQAVSGAHDACTPVEIGVATAFEDRISFNRRFVMKNGLVRTHPRPGSSEISHAEGPIDPQVGVICLKRLDGPVAGFFVNFACHANVTRGNLISADYPGALSRALKRLEGDQCVTVFGNGASGNICQIDALDPDRDFNGSEYAGFMGEVLAERVVAACEHMAFSAEAELRVVTQNVELARRDPEATPYLGTMFAGETYAEVDELYDRLQEALRRTIAEHPTASLEIRAMSIGGAGILMVPVELFVEFGIELKKRSPLEPTFLVSHANGGFGYVPTRRAFERGGYEVRTGDYSQFVREAGDLIVEAAILALGEASRSMRQFSKIP